MRTVFFGASQARAPVLHAPDRGTSGGGCRDRHGSQSLSDFLCLGPGAQPAAPGFQRYRPCPWHPDPGHGRQDDHLQGIPGGPRGGIVRGNWMVPHDPGLDPAHGPSRLHRHSCVPASQVSRRSSACLGHDPWRTRNRGLLVSLLRWGRRWGDHRPEVVSIGGSDTIRDLMARAESASLELLREFMPKVAAGTAPKTPQREEDATRFPQRSPEDGRIDWTWEPRRIRDFIRARQGPIRGPSR